MFTKDYTPEGKISKELFEFKFLLHPLRLAIMKSLSDNPQLTTTDLKNLLNISWTELSNHLKALKKKGYILTESKFIDNSVKVAITIEPNGLSAFHSLGDLLAEFFDQANYTNYLE